METSKKTKTAKISLLLFVLLLVVICSLRVGCAKVEAGHVGVKVYLLGGNKGVDNEVLGVGRYWIGWNEELYKFPTYQQTVAWTKSVEEKRLIDNSFTFQTKEGLSVSADVGLSYNVMSDKVATLFQTYRKGIEEITNIYLRNIVRDALVQAASTRGVEAIYGEGKSDLIETVKHYVSQKTEPVGIKIDYISFIGDLRLPDNVIKSINAKIEATQRAQQRENELREAKAEAEKKIAQFEGDARAAIVRAEAQAKAEVAKADGDAKATIVRAEAQAKANHILARSITPELIRYNSIQTWNGELPKVSGGATPLINLELK